MSCHGVDWDCDRQDCFNKKKRLKFSVFKPALEAAGLPKDISFSDIDGFFERHGFFFFVEWKGKGVTLKTGQRMALEALTSLSEKVIAFVVNGDAEFMTCVSWIPFYGGKQGEEVAGDMVEFLKLLEEWATCAECRTFNEEAIKRREMSRSAHSKIAA
jgi:hypothetical protein